MAKSLDLTQFWETLETNFPLSGPRCDLRGCLGPDTLSALEAGGLLSYLRVANVVSCPNPGGAGCPRQVIELDDGRLQGVCGNDPPECHDIDLTQEDVELLSVEPEVLCQSLRRVLRAGGRTEEIADLRAAYRVGTFIPQPSTRQALYLVIRCAEREYSEAFDALRSQQEGSSFAILVPTDRFIGTGTIRQMATLGIPIISLRGLIDTNSSGQLTMTEDVLRVFAGIGRRSATTTSLSPIIVGQAFTHDGWQDLDDASYRRLLEKVNEYSIVADERSRVVWKRADGRKPPKRATAIKSGYFRMIRAAVERTGYFDPAIEGPMEEQESGQQIFQRARKTIDIKYKDRDGRMRWRLFKTVMVDDHAQYHFNPGPNFKFALIFLPQS